MITANAGGIRNQAKTREGLVLVQIKETKAHKHTTESVWVRPLGGDLYEIKGPLHLIAGLNSGDVVKALTLPDESIPTVLEVVSRSGYKTLHVVFSVNVPTSRQQSVLQALETWNAQSEMLLDRFYTIQIDLKGDIQAVSDYLTSLELEGLLRYEPGVNMDELMRFRFLDQG